MEVSCSSQLYPKFLMNQASYLPLQKMAAFLLSHAILKLFPSAKFLNVSWTPLSFSCECELSFPLNRHLLSTIEEQLKAEAKADIAFAFMEMLPSNAAEMFAHFKQPYFAEQADSQEEMVFLWKHEDFIALDLEGKEAEPFDGDLQLLDFQPVPECEHVVKITGIAASNKQQLKAFAKRWHKAKEEDHRLLGEQMGLFRMHNESVLWLPKGEAILHELELYFRKEVQGLGFSLIKTEASVKEWVKCARFAQKDLDCTPNDKIAEWRISSVKAELPFFARGVGLLERERSFHDRALLCCFPDQVESAIISSLQLIDKTVKLLGFECHWHLQFPRAYSGAKAKESAQKEKWLTKALNFCDLEYTQERDVEKWEAEELGSGFPRVKVTMADALGREWEGPFLGFDKVAFSKEKVWITFSLFGSLDRLVALLLEQTKGLLPFWMTPELLRLVTVGEKKVEEASALWKELARENFSVGFDPSKRKLSEKIHDAEKAKVPWIGVLGEKEMDKDQITLRQMGRKESFRTVAKAQLIQELREAVKNQTEELEKPIENQ